MGEPDGIGADRRHAKGRGVPARRERSRRRGKAALHPLVRGGGLHGGGRPDRQHLCAPPGAQPGSAAGYDRQPSRHPADRRPVRRRLRRLGRARNRAHPERPRLRDRGAGRDRRLDQRGGLAVFAGDGRLGGVRRGVRAGGGAGDARQQCARAVARCRTRTHRLCRAGAGRRTRGRRLFRSAYRARADPRSRRKAGRSCHRRAGATLVRDHGYRPGGACRADADAAAQATRWSVPRG